jgi:transcriptional regulator with XRE-family HTH domain
MGKKPKLADIIEIDGRKVKELRKEAKLTQEDLASLVNRVWHLTRGYLPGLERKPTARVHRQLAQALADALGTTVSQLQPGRTGPSAIAAQSTLAGQPAVASSPEPSEATITNQKLEEQVVAQLANLQVEILAQLRENTAKVTKLVQKIEEVSEVTPQVEELTTKVHSIDQKLEAVLEEAEQKMPEAVPSRGGGQEPIEGPTDVSVASVLDDFFMHKTWMHTDLAHADITREQYSERLQTWRSAQTEPEQIHGAEQVLRRAISLVKESLERPKPPSEILITFLTEQDGFELRPDLKDLKGEWLEALRSAIKSRIRITQLCKLQEGHSNVQTLIRDIFDLLGTPGDYKPFYFPQKYWQILPTYDLLIIPGVGALKMFGTGKYIDTAFFWSIGQDLDGLREHFSYLQRRCIEIFKVYPARSTKFLDAVEHAEGQDGDLYTVKSGLSVKFEPIELLEERVRPIIENGGPKAKQFTDLIDSRKRRQAALFEQLRKGFRVRHICPESAIRDPSYGLYGKDDWTLAYGGHEVMPRQVDKRIQAVVDLLNNRDLPFELALLDEKKEQVIFATSWKVKVGHAVFLESFPLWDTEVDIAITEPTLVKGFQEYYDTLWARLPIKCKNRSKVVKRLNAFI